MYILNFFLEEEKFLIMELKMEKTPEKSKDSHLGIKFLKTIHNFFFIKIYLLLAGLLNAQRDEIQQLKTFVDKLSNSKTFFFLNCNLKVANLWTQT